MLPAEAKAASSMREAARFGTVPPAPPEVEAVGPPAAVEAEQLRFGSGVPQSSSPEHSPFAERSRFFAESSAVSERLDPATLLGRACVTDAGCRDEVVVVLVPVSLRVRHTSFTGQVGSPSES